MTLPVLYLSVCIKNTRKMKNGKNKQKKLITKIIQGGYAFKGVGNYTNLLNFARTKYYSCRLKTFV